MTLTHAVELQGLGKRYGDVLALQPLTLSLPTNSVVGVLGPNGAGKTTTFKLLLGLIRPSMGEGRVLGRDITRDSMGVRQRTGYLSQNPAFYAHMTAREILAFVARLHFTGPRGAVEAIVDSALELVGLDDRDDRPVGGFSGGERQRLGIAQAYIGRPELLILDEPAASLDPMGRRDVLDIVLGLKGKATVLYSTHILGDVERVADRVIVLDRGELLAEGALEEFASSAARRRASYLVTLVGYGLSLQGRLASQPWIGEMRIRMEGAKAELTISTDDSAGLESGLLRLLLSDPSVTVLDFRRREESLEDWFLKLMRGRKLREPE